MKGKAFTLLLVASLLTSMLLMGIGTVAADYVPGADAKFKLQIESPYDIGVPAGLNWTGPPPNVGEKYNVSVYLEDVTEMVGYVVTLAWNNSVCNATENIWFENPWAPASQISPIWGFGTYPAAHIGYLDSATTGITSDKYNYNVTTTGEVKLFTVEFQVGALGHNWLYIVKTSGTRESLLLDVVGLSASAYQTATLGFTDYDVIWLVEDDSNVDMHIVPEFLAYLLMPLFLIATIIAVVLRKAAWSKGPRGRMDVK